MCLQNNHDAFSFPICSKWISDCMFKDSFTLRQACKCDSLVTQPGLNRDAGSSENESQIAGTRETNTNVGWHMHISIYMYIHPSTISFGVPRISEEKQESQMGYFAVPERDLCSENFVHFHIMDFLWSCHLPLFVFFYIINNHLLPYFLARVEDVKHCPKKC